MLMNQKLQMMLAARRNHKCSDIFKTYFGVSVTIEKAFHLGKKSSKMKISLGNAQQKSAILKNKFKLSNPPDMQKIFITPDFIPFEQKQNKELRQTILSGPITRQHLSFEHQQHLKLLGY